MVSQETDQNHMDGTLVTRFSLWIVVSVTVSAKGINQFKFQYWTEAKIVVSVVHYIESKILSSSILQKTNSFFCKDHSQC